MTAKEKAGKTAYRKGWLMPFLFSLIFAVSVTFGRCLDKEGSVPFKSPMLWLWLLFLLIVCLFSVKFVFSFLLKAEEGKEKGERQEITAGCFFRFAGLIFLCYLPVFLAVYPGFFVYDAQDELMQVITRNFSSHHPLLHVLLLGGIIQFVHKLSGSYNLGIACYTLIQMAAMSCIYAYAVCCLKQEGVRKRGTAALIIYFGLFPVLVMFSLCSAKDGLFTGMLLLMVLLLRKLTEEPEQFFLKKGNVILLAAASFLLMMFRHNGFYAFLVFAVIFLLCNRNLGLTRYRKKLAFLFIIVIAGYLLFSKGLVFALQADTSENQEMLTVPIQQMARVYAMEKESLSEEEKAVLHEILPEEALLKYTPKVSDPVKIAFNNEAYKKNPIKYAGLWMKLGIRHPFAYLNAWFMTSYGFWYPATVIDVYRGNTVFTFTYKDSSYFGYEVEEPGERHSMIPAVEQFYRWLSLEPAIQRMPIVSLLFSPGFLFLVMLFILSYFCHGGYVRKWSPYLPAFLVFLTVLLGPTYLVRYVVFLWALLPVLLWDLKRI